MPLSINTNLPSLNAQRQVSRTQNSLNRTLERLSSGLRINSAKDDAAGMAISNRFSSQIRGSSQAIRNSNDAISILQTAEGGMHETTSLLQRMREIAVQASNDTYSDSDRASLQLEMDQLYTEIDRIADSTQYNGMDLLNGAIPTRTFQVGANAGETITAELPSVKTKDLYLNGVPTTQINGNSVSTNALSAGDLIINGINVGVSTGASAADKAQAINGVSDLTGVSASVDIAVGTYTIDFSQITTDLTSDDLKINGVGIDLHLAANIDDVIAAIGLAAVPNFTASSNAQGQLVLTATTGADINIIESKPILTDEFGVAFTKYTIPWYSITNCSSETLTAGDLVINNIDVGTSGPSAADKAGAINSVYPLTGVSATAKTVGTYTIDFSQITTTMTSDDLTINSVGVDIHLANDLNDIVSAINLASIPNLAASSNGAKLILTSSSGEDIGITESRPILADEFGQAFKSSGMKNDITYVVCTSGLLVGSAYNGQTANPITPHVITGPIGTATVSLSPNQTIKDLADKVNNVQGITGVSAQGETKVSMGFRFATGSIYPKNMAFRLYGKNTTPVNIQFTINTPTDLTPLADAINAESDTTNITATVNAAGGIIATCAEGYNITIRSLKVNDINGTPIGGLLDVFAIDQNNNRITGNATFQANLGITYTFGGYITCTASDTFSVLFKGNNYSSVADPSTITWKNNLIGSIELTSQNVEDIQISGNAPEKAGIIFDIILDIYKDINHATIDLKSNNGEDIIISGNAPENAGFTKSEKDNLSVLTHDKANIAIDRIDKAIDIVSEKRGNLGAVLNRLDSTISNLQNSFENFFAANGRLVDADYAKESAEMAKSQILMQAGVGMMAQTKQLPDMVLQLLQQ